jgi:site-specific recombinase XerD
LGYGRPALLNTGVDICKLQGLLSHNYITMTQSYGKRQLSTAESASHDLPI